jgi:GTP-binding protein
MATQRHPPPAVNGRRIKPKYMAQMKARPPTFVLFASRADQLPDHYRRYLVHSIRESFELPGVPIRLTVKSNRNPFVEGEAPKASKERAPTVKPVRTPPPPPPPMIVAAETTPSKPPRKKASLGAEADAAGPPKGPATTPKTRQKRIVLTGTKGPRAMAKKAKIISRATRSPGKSRPPKSKSR